MHRVFIDANVLCSKTQYDWLFMLKLEKPVYALVTSADVLDEAHRRWRKKHPEAPGDMRARRDKRFRGMIDDVLEQWPGGAAPNIKDVNDQHVHNAAAASGADILLTDNVRDFGDPDELPYCIYTPDELFTLIAANHPDIVREVTRKQAKYWAERNALKTNGRRYTLDEALVKAGCPEFAKDVAEQLHVLTGLPPQPARQSIA